MDYFCSSITFKCKVRCDLGNTAVFTMSPFTVKTNVYTINIAQNIEIRKR